VVSNIVATQDTGDVVYVFDVMKCNIPNTSVSVFAYLCKFPNEKKSLWQEENPSQQENGVQSNSPFGIEYIAFYECVQ
jgi:hypothetical protein